MLVAQGGGGKALMSFEQADEVRLVGETAGVADALYWGIAIEQHHTGYLHLLGRHPSVRRGAQQGCKVALEGRGALVAVGGKLLDRGVGEQVAKHHSQQLFAFGVLVRGTEHGGVDIVSVHCWGSWLFYRAKVFDTLGPARKSPQKQ